MPLKPCRECGKEISTLAKTCPHCGVNSPAINQATQTTKWVFILGIIAVGIAFWDGGRTQTAPNDVQTTSAVTPPAVVAVQPICKTDWRLCADNADMANNYGRWHRAKAACKIASEKLAKYGDPKWPWLAFSHFLGGADYAQSGLAVLIEPDVQFQNGFGAMQHVQVRCDYDLTSETVLNAAVN